MFRLTMFAPSLFAALPRFTRWPPSQLAPRRYPFVVQIPVARAIPVSYGH
jgi:hypothetical protein